MRQIYPKSAQITDFGDMWKALKIASTPGNWDIGILDDYSQRSVRKKVSVLRLPDKKVSHDLLHLTVLTTLTCISYIIYLNKTFQPLSLISHGYHFPDDPFNKKKSRFWKVLESLLKPANNETFVPTVHWQSAADVWSIASNWKPSLDFLWASMNDCWSEQQLWK